MLIGKKVLAFGCVLASSAFANPFTGPTSPYYLDDFNNQTIYVVQGTAVINSFAWAYGRGSQGETTMAVSNTVNTRPYVTPNPNSGGQYTLSGTPTGHTEPYPTPTGLSTEISVDGTSDGTYNYYVEVDGDTLIGNTPTENVYRTDLDWQNPVLLFSVQTIPGVSSGEYAGIAYDPANKSLWISGYGYNDKTIKDYSLHGLLISSFNPGFGFSYALGFDPADGTLWLDNPNNLEQWSTSGVLLQSGNPAGLPTCCFFSGDFSITAPSAVPEPGSILLLATTLSAIALIRRRKRSALPTNAEPIKSAPPPLRNAPFRQLRNSISVVYGRDTIGLG